MQDHQLAPQQQHAGASAPTPEEPAASQGPGGRYSLAGVLLNRAQQAQRLPQDSPDYEVWPGTPLHPCCGCWEAEGRWMHEAAGMGLVQPQPMMQL